MTEQKTAEIVAVTKSEFVEETEKTFDLTEAGKAVVTVSNVSGAVMVEAWDQPTVHVRAVKRARSQRSFDRTRVEMSQSGEQITVRTVIDEEAIVAGVMDFLRGERAGATVEYALKVPAACAVRAKTVNGSVTLAGLSNQSEANSVNGMVRLSSLAGQAVGSTVNGTLEADSLAGSAELRTVNGSLILKTAQLRQLDARTVSGNIRAELNVDPEGAYSFNSTNGDCALILPPGSRCTITMQAVNGGVECALPHKTLASEMRPAFSRWEGAVNGGGTPVSFRTINGRLRVTSAGPETPDEPQAEPAMGEAVAPQEERSTMEILQAIERGELTVEQAMQKLKERK